MTTTTTTATTATAIATTAAATTLTTATASTTAAGTAFGLSCWRGWDCRCLCSGGCWCYLSCFVCHNKSPKG